MPPPDSRPPFREALGVFVRIALMSFGGPAGQISVMHRLVVDEKKWMSEERFLHALNYCMLLPGPEAQQLATYIGWLLHGWRGGLTAGLLFILPGFLSILLLSVLYAGFQGFTPVAAIFYGLKPAIMAVVVQAVIRIGQRALKNGTLIALAACAFVAIFFFEIPFPLIVVSAAVLGVLGGRWRPGIFPERTEETTATVARPPIGRAVRVASLWLVIWLAPIALLALAVGAASVFVQEGVFFSKTAVVTFGGAYAVLAYVAQQAVDRFGWLQPGEMLDGLGMAETTPGPLIQVVQFVGFMAAYRFPGGLDPMVAGVIGSVVVTWATFAPCFLWIFVGAPYIEWLRGHRALTWALTAITASVVGVILNLAVWFSLHTVFGEVNETHVFGMRILTPDHATIDPAATLIAIGAFVALFRFKVNMLVTLAGGVALGAIWYLIR